MSQRLRTLFYRLGSFVAVLAIASGVVWNVAAFQERQAAQENLRNLPPQLAVREAATAAAFARQRASTAALKRSVTFGGALVLGGLIVYGLAWTVRRGGRRPGDNRWE